MSKPLTARQRRAQREFLVWREQAIETRQRAIDKAWADYEASYAEATARLKAAMEETQPSPK